MSSGRIEPKPPPKILVVDSIRVIREWVRDTLSEAGYRVAAVSRLGQIGDQPGDDVNAVLVADRMPEVDVPRAIRHWQRPGSSWCGSVLVLVSDPQPFTTVQAFDLRIADCLFMPLKPAELTWRVRLALRRQDAAPKSSMLLSSPSPPATPITPATPSAPATLNAPSDGEPASSPAAARSAPAAVISRLRLLREFEEPLANTRALTEQMTSRWLTADALASLAVLRGFLEATRRLIAGPDDGDADPTSRVSLSEGNGRPTTSDGDAAEAIRSGPSPGDLGSDRILRWGPADRPVPAPHRPAISKPLNTMRLPDPPR